MSITKKAMSLWPQIPDPDDYGNWEIFKQDRFLTAKDELRNRMLYNSVHFNYLYETDHCTLSKYFPQNLCQDFQNKSLLDLGCFTGGRLFRWVEKFQFSEGTGIDINPIFKEAGEYYLKEHKKDSSRIKFSVGKGESLPFEDEKFDHIFSYDVFEHVEDVAATVKECRRVLKKGGTMFAVFPQYYQPLESHLGFVTKMPALQWFLNPEKITNAYCEIIKERGPSADWYALDSNKLNNWEKLPSLNGITVRKFNRIVKNSGLVEVFRGKPPVFGDGRKAEQFLFFKILKYMCWLPAKIPILDEIFLGRIVTVLKKV